MEINHIKTIVICILLLSGLAYFPDAFLYLSLIIFLILLFIPKGRNFIKTLGFQKQENWLKTIGIVIVGYASILGAQTLATVVFPDIFKANKPLFFADIEGNLVLYIYSVVSGVIIGGFVEEMLFRGFMLTRLTKIFGNSNLVSLSIVSIISFIFGFMHLYQSMEGAILTGIFSFITGIIFIKTKYNLWITIIIHSIFNIVTFTAIYLGIA